MFEIFYMALLAVLPANNVQLIFKTDFRRGRKSSGAQDQPARDTIDR